MNDRSIDGMLHSIAKGTTITFLGTLVGTILTYLTKMVIARTFGPENYGLLRLGLSLMYIGSTLAIMGLNSGVARYISFYRAKSDYEGVKGTLISASKAVCILSAGIGTLLFLTSALLSSVFHESRLTRILWMLAIFFPFFSLNRVLLAGVRGFRRMDYIALSDNFIAKVGRLTLIVLAIIIGCDVLGLSVAYAFSFFIAPFTSFYFLKRCFRKEATWKKLDTRPLFSELFRFSYPLMIGESISQIRNQTDTIMLGYFTTASLVGIYNAALPIGRILQTGLNSINSIFMPSMADLYATEQLDEMQRMYKQVARWAFYLTFPLFLSMIIFPEEFLVLLFGRNYQSGRIALQILATGIFINAISGSFGETLIAVGKTKINMYLSVAGVLANFTLNFLLIPRFAINGAALATSISIVLICVGGMGYLFHSFQIQPFSWRHLQFIVILFALAAILYPMASYGNFHYGSWVVVPFSITLYLIGLFLFHITSGFDDVDKQILMKAFRKIIPYAS